ncbi:MAG TPA: Imm1 family immunity protein [Pseudonocardiaceae bacterium]
MMLSVGGSDHAAAQAVHDETTLRTVLEQGNVEYPVAFQLRTLPVTRGQGSLMVGVHNERGVLWWSNPAQGESLIALGGDNAADVVYYIGNADFELPPGAELPRTTVIDAAVEFLTTGQRPLQVRSWVDEHQAFSQPHPVPHAS